jgi:hypothetical protein
LPNTLDAIYVQGNRVYLNVADGTDEATVQQVYEAHNPPPEKTRKQILKEQAKASIRERSPSRIADRARDKLIYKVLLETRAYVNTLSQALANADLPVPPMPLSTRTFAQIEAAADAEVDAEVESLEE